MYSFKIYLDSMASTTTAFTLHVISSEIVICATYGDVMKTSTCRFWLDAIRSGFVIAKIAGPPCESWSRARGVPLEPHPDLLDTARQRGPRITRDIHHLWGKDCATMRELMQLFTGNSLLGFTILAFMELAFATALA